MATVFPHFGFQVKDIERSARFYVEVLGFKVDSEPGGSEIGDLIGLPGAQAQTLFLQHPAGGRFELYNYANYPATDADPARALTERGLFHMCFVVDDLDATVARVLELGGHMAPGKEVSNQWGRIVFVTDPDGVRIELVQAAMPQQ